MSQKELLRIITLPGFSTAERVTQTSGRGVGMDVVKKNVERLNGTFEIDSEGGPGHRSAFGFPDPRYYPGPAGPGREDVFTIPLSAVEETLRILESETSIVEGVEVIHLRDRNPADLPAL